MGGLHALGWTGCARRIDEREKVVGPDGAPRGLEVEVRVRIELAELLDQDDVRSLRDPTGERALDNGQRVAGIGEQVLDLLGRARVVDTEGRRAEVDGGEVDDMELGPVDHHQPYRVARPDTQPVQSARDALDLVAQLRVGQLRRPVGRAHRDRVPAPGRRDLERLAQRPRVECVGP